VRFQVLKKGLRRIKGWSEKGSFLRRRVFEVGESGGSGDEEEGKTGMLMKRWGILRGKEENLVEDLRE
jgi:hypothetical protein